MPYTTHPQHNWSMHDFAMKTNSSKILSQQITYNNLFWTYPQHKRPTMALPLTIQQNLNQRMCMYNTFEDMYDDIIYTLMPKRPDEVQLSTMADAALKYGEVPRTIRPKFPIWEGAGEIMPTFSYYPPNVPF